jgi:hypothetical protein
LSFEEQKELLGFRAFKESINGSLRDYIQNHLECIIPYWDSFEQEDMPTEYKITALTQVMVDIIEWRCDYETKLQLAHHIIKE